MRIYHHTIFFVFAFYLSPNSQSDLSPILTHENFEPIAEELITTVTNTAFETGDKIALKNIIQNLLTNNCKDNNWRSPLLALHYDINVKQEPLFSLKAFKLNCDSTLYFSEEIQKNNYEVIRNNHEILSLIKNNIIDYDIELQKFKTRVLTSFTKTLYHAKLHNCKSMADIGAGQNTLGILAGILYPDLEIYVNEIDSSYLSYANRRLEIYEQLMNKEKFHLVHGSATSTNIKEQVDLETMRYVLHHFKHKETMLKSIKENLKANGKLLVFETLPHKTKKETQCKSLISKKEILKSLRRQRFKSEKKLVSKTGIYLIYTNSR